MSLPHTQLAPFDPNIGDWSRGGYSIPKTRSNMLGSIISGAGSLLGGLFGGLFGNYQQRQANVYNQQQLRQQFRYNQILARQQLQYNQQLSWDEYQRNLQQWRLENEYNSPAAQLSRLTQAGINPHLAYAKGSINNVAASSPSYNAPSYNAPEYGYAPSAIPDTSGYITAGQNAFQNVVRSVIENRNLAAQGDYVRAQTQRTLLQAAGQATNNRIKAALETDAVKQGQYKTQTMESEVDEVRWRVDNLIQSYEGKRLLNDFNAATFDKRVEKLRQTVLNLKAQEALNKVNAAYRRKVTDELLPQQVSLTKGQAQAILAQGGFTGNWANAMVLLKTLGIPVESISAKLKDKVGGAIEDLLDYWD